MIYVLEYDSNFHIAVMCRAAIVISSVKVIVSFVAVVSLVTQYPLMSERFVTRLNTAARVTSQVMV